MSKMKIFPYDFSSNKKLPKLKYYLCHQNNNIYSF